MLLALFETGMNDPSVSWVIIINTTIFAHPVSFCMPVRHLSVMRAGIGLCPRITHKQSISI
jgi:hypothetical protein